MSKSHFSPSSKYNSNVIENRRQLELAKEKALADKKKKREIIAKKLNKE